MLAMTPWSLARRSAAGRRGVVMILLTVLLYALCMHAARACHPAAAAVHHGAEVVAEAHCGGGDEDVDVAQAACEAHCRNDAQSSRLSLSFDLPAAAPAVFAPPAAPMPPAQSPAPGFAPELHDWGPPLHILLHRLLR